MDVAWIFSRLVPAPGYPAALAFLAVTAVRWIDWISLLTPYVVVGTALAVLAATGTDRRGWTTALLGAGAAVHGHGISLAAGSIGNVRGDVPPIRLWDQVVGAWYWYGGIVLIVLAVARAVWLPPGSGAPPAAGRPGVSVPRLLVLSAVAMILTHWLRLAPLGVAAPGATRWEDFADLLTPYVVVGPLLVVLARTGASRRLWLLALTGAAVFVQGHGLHLSANSISYADGPQEPAYFWDEQAGHALWFVGLTLVLVAVAQAVRAVPLPLPMPRLAAFLAGLVGLTWAANVIEAGHVPLGAGLALALAGYGWCTRERTTGPLLVLSFGLSLVAVAAYGLVQGGFPQPSELGWL